MIPVRAGFEPLYLTLVGDPDPLAIERRAKRDAYDAALRAGCCQSIHAARKALEDATNAELRGAL